MDTWTGRNMRYLKTGSFQDGKAPIRSVHEGICVASEKGYALKMKKAPVIQEWKEYLLHTGDG